MRNGFLFQDAKQNKAYIDNFLTFLKQQQKEDLIDTGIYTKNRCFRTIHCSKKDSSRILQRCNYNEISQTCKEKDFFVSYIIPELMKASKQSCLSMVDERKKLNTLAYEQNCYYLKYIETEIKQLSKKTPIGEDEEQPTDEVGIEAIKTLLDILDIRH